MKTNAMIFDDTQNTQDQKFCHVSKRCRFTDEGDMRFVFQDEILVYTYHLSDRATERMVWIMIYEHELATYKQIATSIGKGERTVQGWVARYRKKGLAGVQDAKKCGAPVKLTASMRKRILRLRAEKFNLNEIARACSISVSSVRKVLREHKKDIQEKQVELDLTTDQNEQAAQEISSQTEVETELENHTQISPEEKRKVALPVASDQKVIDYDDHVENVLSQDRSYDRRRASQGEIQDAQPLFGNTEHAEWAGAFMMIVLLSQDAYLATAMNLYQGFAAAFYGLRTMLVTWMLMALLRIKCSEQIRETDVTRLGRILGLDRAPEVKTIRRKLHELIGQEKALEWMQKLAEARVKEFDGPINTVEIDGHIVAYFGKQKIGNVYCSRTKQVVKGQTENWVNLPHAGGLFLVTSPFNEGLSRMLEKVVKKACEVTDQSSLTLVFDRGGYNTEVFERLINAGHHIITYRKGTSKDIPLDMFDQVKTTIGKRTYEYAPYEHDISLNIYITKTDENGKQTRRKSKRSLCLREIRIVREDGGQTVILTDSKNTKMDAQTVAEKLFGRTGSQENYFKYMRQEFNMDATGVYKLDDITDETLLHPNRAYTKLEMQKAKKVETRRRELEKYASELIDCTPKEAAEILKTSGKKEQAETIIRLNQEIDKLATEMKETQKRESVSGAKYKRLNEDARAFQNCIKTSAYHIESQLVDMLNDHYANTPREGRRLIASALKTTGSIRLEQGKLIIRLEAQSSRIRTRAINQVLLQLNEMQSRFPGSNRIIYFEQTTEPVPVLHNI